MEEINKQNIEEIQNETKQNLINQLSELWEKWLECYLEVEGRERFISSYIDPRQAAKLDENLFEKRNATSIQECFNKCIVNEGWDETLSSLNDVFTKMLDNSDLFFMLGSKIARMSLEKGRKRYQNFDDEGPSDKYQKLN